MTNRPGTDWRIRAVQDIGDLNAGVSSVNGKVDVIQSCLSNLDRGIRDLVVEFRKVEKTVESAGRDFTGFQSEVKTLIRAAKWIGGLLSVGVAAAVSTLWAVHTETTTLVAVSRHHAERLAKLDRIAEDVAVLKASLASLPGLTKSVGELVVSSRAIILDRQRIQTTALRLERHKDRYHLLLTSRELLPEKEGGALKFLWPLPGVKEDWIRRDPTLDSLSVPLGNIYSGKAKSAVAELIAHEGRGELRITLDFGGAAEAEWARKQLADGHPLPVEVVFDHNPNAIETGGSDLPIEGHPVPPPDPAPRSKVGRDPRSN